MRNKLVAILLASGLAGCGSLIKDRSQVPMTPVGGFGTTMGSPKSLSPRNSGARWNNADVVTLDLPQLIGRYSTPPVNAQSTLEAALADFDRGADSPDSRGARRNAIVGAVIMASDKNCDVYLEYLHGNQIAIRGLSSVAATVLSGAGAIATPTHSAQLLSALGAASTGIGGNLNDAVFSNKAADVIASGIRADRAGLRAAIDVKMRSADYANWPLSLALADAFIYHGRCNAISGMSFLQGKAEEARGKAEGSDAQH